MTIVGVIGAMDEEIDLLTKNMELVDENSFASMKFISGKLNGSSIVVANCGVGKVNASICAQILVSHFNVSHIIFTGVAGAIDSSLRIGDIVVSTDCVQWDVDAQALGFKPGQICFTDLRFFTADNKLIEAAMHAAANLNLKSVKGRILTGDKFITNSEELTQLQKKFHGICIEMEGAAVGHTCALNNIPFVIIRSISDKADNLASADFEKFMSETAKNSAAIVIKILEKI